MNKRSNGFSRIDKTLGNAAKEYKLENALYKHRTLKHWHEVAGAFLDEAKSETQAIDFNKGVLTVACLSKEVAGKLKMLAQRIIYALNQLLGKQMVFAIYVEV